MFSADFSLEDLVKVDGTTTTTTKSPTKVPAATKAPVKPKPKPGERAHLRVL